MAEVKNTDQPVNEKREIHQSRSYAEVLRSKEKEKTIDQPQMKASIERAKSKVNSILLDKNNKKPVCFRCGTRGHMAGQCRNALTCFACNRIGHIARECREAKREEVLNRSDLLKEHNKENSKKIPDPQKKEGEMEKGPRVKAFASSVFSNELDDHFAQSFVLIDSEGWGEARIGAALRHLMPDYPWRVRFLGDNTFLIEAPHNWRERVISDNFVTLDGVDFEVRRWDPASDEGFRLRSVWVRVEGFPMKLWHQHEFERLVEDFAVVLEIDPATASLADFSAAKLRLGVCDPKMIPAIQWIRFKTRRNEWRSFQVKFTLIPPKRGYGAGNGGPGPGPNNNDKGGNGGQGGSKFRKVWKEKDRQNERQLTEGGDEEDLLDEEDKEDRRKIGSRRAAIDQYQEKQQKPPIIESHPSQIQSSIQSRNRGIVITEQSSPQKSNKTPKLQQGVKGKAIEKKGFVVDEEDSQMNVN